MGFIDKILGREQRSSPENPSVSLANPSAWLLDFVGSGRSMAGVEVNQRSGLQSTAVWACVRVLSQDVGTLPLHVFKMDGQSKEKAVDHPVYDLVHTRPNSFMTAMTFRQTLTAHALTWGNGYAQIKRNGAGRPIELMPITPDRVTPKLVVNPDSSVRKIYEVKVNGSTVLFSDDDIFHLPGLGFDGITGYSPITMHREAIGLSLATEKFGAAFFGNGSRAGGIMTHPQTLGKEAQQRLKESWNEMHQGVDNAHKIAVFEEGMTFTPLSINPDDAQFLETRKFSVIEIARIYGVPPHKIQSLDGATFSNIEQQSQEYVNSALTPWLKQWEESLNWSLFTAAERKSYYVLHNLEGLLRGDTAARGAFYTQLLTNGTLSINEVRELENRNPIEGGDRHMIAANNMAPLDSIPAAGATPAPAAAPAPAEPAARSLPDLHEADLVRSAVIASAADAVVHIVRDSLDRARVRESIAATRALKKGLESFGEWSEDYYAGHTDFVAGSLVPALSTLAHVLSGQEPDIEMRAFLSTHAGLIARAEVDATTNEIRSRLSCHEGPAGIETISAYYDGISAKSTAVRAKAIVDQATASISGHLKMQGHC